MSVYAVSDLHGCISQWLQIQKFLKPEDTIYVLGDCADRGPDGWGTLKSVLEEPRAILLQGNHEDMLCQTLMEERDFGNSDYAFYNLACNGGAPTYDAWQLDGRDFKYINILKNLPYYATYINTQGQTIFLSHSGQPPCRNRFTGELVSGKRGAIWDREHLSKDSKLEDNLIIVHGHTPIPFLARELGYYDIELEPGAYWYCHDQKVDIDNGSFATGYVVVLDLDTWEEHIFEGE